MKSLHFQLIQHLGAVENYDILIYYFELQNHVAALRPWVVYVYLE